MKNDDGALSFGTAIDMSGFDAGIEQIEGKVAGLTSNVEVETSKISQLLANVPTLNIEVVTNASQSLSTIDTAYAELDRVIDTNRSSVLALEEQYRQLGSEISNLPQTAADGDQGEYSVTQENRYRGRESRRRTLSDRTAVEERGRGRRKECQQPSIAPHPIEAITGRTRNDGGIGTARHGTVSRLAGRGGENSPTHGPTPRRRQRSSPMTSAVCRVLFRDFQVSQGLSP